MLELWDIYNEMFYHAYLDILKVKILLLKDGFKNFFLFNFNVVTLLYRHYTMFSKSNKFLQQFKWNIPKHSTFNCSFVIQNIRNNQQKHIGLTNWQSVLYLVEVCWLIKYWWKCQKSKLSMKPTKPNWFNIYKRICLRQEERCLLSCYCEIKIN
jgi:hypothetical protein